VVVDRIDLPEVKTKGLLAALGTLKVTTPREGKKSAKALVVDTAANENLKLSIRNSVDHQYLPPEGVNLYDLLRHDTLVLSRDAAKLLEQRCLRTAGQGEARNVETPAAAPAAKAAKAAGSAKAASKPKKEATK
jgi:large subunit ribosomal protein L4